MEYPISHYFLVRSDSNELAARHVQHYLAGNQLISYAEFFVEPEEAFNGTDPLFEQTLRYGLAANDSFARRMLAHPARLRSDGPRHLPSDGSAS